MSASAILKLQAAGFTAEQVTAIAELIDTQSATKADVEGAEHRMTAKIEAAEHRLDLKIAEFRAEMRAELEAVDRRLDMRIAKVEAELRLIRWMMGFVLAFQVASFVKMFVH